MGWRSSTPALFLVACFTGMIPLTCITKSDKIIKTARTFVLIELSQVTIRLKAIMTHPYFPVLVLIAVNICVGRFIVATYGESWDEANNKIYGEQSLKAYAWWINGDTELDAYLGPTDQKYRGPAYAMIASLFVSWIQTLNKGWASIDLWHYTSFLCFQLGVFFFYMICIRCFKIWAAFGATLLFVTQPLLWGHAFINSKDIPMMVFFLGSIALGLKMVDSFLAIRPSGQLAGKDVRLLIKQDWAASTSAHRNAFIVLFESLIAFWAISKFIQGSIARIIATSYNADPASFLGTLFSRLASHSNSMPLEAYLHKGMLLYERVAIFTIVTLLILFVIVSHHIFRNALTEIWGRLLSRFSKWLILVAAAVMLGLAISTRVIGEFAGMLIAGYFLVKARKRSIPALITYASIAAFITYITWPYLWPNPVGNFLDSLAISSDFGWTGDVLFQGLEYEAQDLPASYLPVLLALQFTEPVLILFGVGVALAVAKMLKHTNQWEDTLIPLAWLFAPLLCIFTFRPTMYDNFRHWLFIVPAIFLLAGLALDKLFTHLRLKTAKTVALLALLLPGIYWGVKLHPYQYVYYNGLTGGLNGAYHQFELDYWVTSYREATLYLNQEAPLNSQVLVVGPRRIFMSYAREDLNREWFTTDQIDETTDPVFVIVSTRYNDDLTHFPDAKIVYRVIRDGAVLAVVKQIQ